MLINIGLSSLQAKAYLFLIEHGPSAPKTLTSELKITRTNAYKVLEALEDVGLVYKSEQSKKIIYTPADPSALSSLVAEKRNNIIALEQNVSQAMQQLRRSYGKHTANLETTAKIGRESMIEAYSDQAKIKRSIYFIKSRADIPFMGFETMDTIRKLQGKESSNRYGITTDSPEGPLNNELDRATRLTRTWIDEKDYTAPVEWSVSADRLIIQVFDNKGSVISIKNTQVAESFRQIWHLMNKGIRIDPNYRSIPHKAKRRI